jgi:hypothetical protein
MQKIKSNFWKGKAKKSDKTSSFATGAGLRLRPKSACATGMGLDATVSVDLCHRSGLEYLSHGFQTQGTISARAGLKVRLKSTCVSGPWISDPRYGCHRSGLEGCDRSRLVYLGHGFQTQGTVATVVYLKVATVVDLCTWAIDFKPKVRSVST